MFNPDKPERKVNRGSAPPSEDDAPAPKVRYDWKNHTQAELLRFFNEIKGLLPPLKLEGLNLEEELLLQLHTVRYLQGEVMEDETIPPNQRAQVANSVASSLAKVIELQVEVFSSERFKRIEGFLVRHLGDLDEAVAAKFLDEYEKMLTDAGI